MASAVKCFKGPLSGLRQFLAIKRLKLMKNAFYFTQKALLDLEIFKFLLWDFGHTGKQLDKKAKKSFEIDDATNWIANNYNTHIARSLKK